MSISRRTEFRPEATAQPGSLYVTMQLEQGQSVDQFHEWYNNEHGPTRLKLPHIFTNGLRYRAIDGKEPTFLAAYDVTSMPHLETDAYTCLRAKRSEREAQVIGRIEVTRYFWDLLFTCQDSRFTPIEDLTDEQADGLVLLTAQRTLEDNKNPEDSPEDNPEERIEGWFRVEHIGMMSRVPGWLRSRLFKTSSLERDGPTQYIALHDFSRSNGLDEVTIRDAMTTPWARERWEKLATPASARLYGLFYVFGPGSRDLYSLKQLPPAATVFRSPDGNTFTGNDPIPVIESTVTTPDGLTIPYRLEGNPDQGAPTIAFCNSLLTSLHMWDPFIEVFSRRRPQYRILRYDFRGRHAIPHPPKPSTLDMLADDLGHLMTALRIPKLETLMGVSMGGATALKFALKYPDRLGRFVACDFNATSSAANTSAWKSRIEVAEGVVQGDSADKSHDAHLSGMSKLAAQTVERWFHPSTMQDQGHSIVPWMRDMIAQNDIEGFRYGCQALWDYDMKPDMVNCEVPGLFVVGDQDGKGALVKSMHEFKGHLGRIGNAGLAVVPKAGHLPMVEQPLAFWGAVKNFLG